MSNQDDPISNSLNIQSIQAIDDLDLPIMQKHHVRILAHCLNVMKASFANSSSSIGEEDFLREWCDNQSKKFEDKKFSDLLYEKMTSTAKTLNTFSERIGKNIHDLDIEDLVLLVGES